MYTPKHYTPILRWKTAEKEALKELADQDKQMITPLIEVIMPSRVRLKKGEKSKTREEYQAQSIQKIREALPLLPKEISKYWGNQPIFVDLNLLIGSELQQWGYSEILSELQSTGSFIIPVLHLGSDGGLENKVVELVKRNNRGVCLRVLRNDLLSSGLSTKIENFLAQQNINPEQVDLLVDFELVENISTDEYLRMVEATQTVPRLLVWKSFTVAGGAFPCDLSQFPAHNTYRISRTDWNCWFNYAYSGTLKRKPAFADYTIQHPIYTEPNPEANPSASIRYAGEKEWVIMRGEALHKVGKDGNEGPGHSQYPSHAQLLMLEPEYCGKDYSYGDAYIAEKGKDVDVKETGNPRTWLRASVNHHLVLVVRQIASLS
jgi:hypothetical protein